VPVLCGLVFLAFVTQGPNISRDCLKIFARKLHAAHRRHGARGVPSLEHTVLIVSVIAARLPSLQSQVPLLRSAPTACRCRRHRGSRRRLHPRSHREKSFCRGRPLACCSRWNGRAAASLPASGWMPSGGRTSGDVLASTAGDGAASMPVTLGSPLKVTRQMRPALSSEMKSAPSVPTASPEGRCAARPGSLYSRQSRRQRPCKGQKACRRPSAERRRYSPPAGPAPRFHEPWKAMNAPPT